MKARFKSKSPKLLHRQYRLKPRYFNIIICLLLWSSLIAYLNIVPPSSLGNIIGFYVIFFLAILNTLYLFSRRFRLNLTLSLFTVVLLILQTFRQLNLLNFLLAAALIYTLSAWSKRA